MNDAQKKVKEFMQTFGQECPDKPTKIDGKTHLLRIALIAEELDELSDAFCADQEHYADAIGDLLYVVYGTAVACGIDIEPIFNEIHRSNMTKLWKGNEIGMIQPDCTATCVVSGFLDERTLLVKRNDGKVVKSPSYSKAELKPILDAQKS